MAAPGLLIVVSGPSGTGKGTICKALLQRRTDMFVSVSATTRPPRAGEAEGVNYYFKDKTAFESMIAKDEFLEWAVFCGNYYGTPRGPVCEALAQGKDVVLEIDIQGALKVKNKAPQGVYIFIVPPSLDVLRARITGRGTDSQDVIDRRMGEALRELAHLPDYDYVVINDVLQEAVDKVESIISAEHCRTRRFRLADDFMPDKPLVMVK